MPQRVSFFTITLGHVLQVATIVIVYAIANGKFSKLFKRIEIKVDKILQILDH